MYIQKASKRKFKKESAALVFTKCSLKELYYKLEIKKVLKYVRESVKIKNLQEKIKSNISGCP